MYERVARKWGHDPLTTLKSIQNHLADLTMLVFLDRSAQNEGRAGSVHYRYELTGAPRLVFDDRFSELEVGRAETRPNGSRFSRRLSNRMIGSSVPASP